jgi:putative ABC transport system substrate-binding protein
MKRREFITLLGGAAAAWPLRARAQQRDRMRRIGVIMALEEADPQAKAWLSSLTQGLSELGWTEGRNLRMDVRWPGGNADRIRMFAKELVDLQPEVIFGTSTPVTATLHRETQTIPIIFAIVADPVGFGFVTSLSRPGGNLTGFQYSEGEMGSKWLGLLKEIAPGIKRAAMIFNPDTASYVLRFYGPSFEAAAKSLEVEPTLAPVRSDAEIETVITSLGREPRGGFISMPDHFTLTHRAALLMAASRNNVPAIYNHSIFAKEGGLLSYGPDFLDAIHRAATYVDRILKGEKPADLPVQAPVKYELAINARTAKALGLIVPDKFLAVAEEVIE